MTGGPSPSRSNAMGVPSADVTISISLRINNLLGKDSLSLD
jgi:hypothetical protein